MSIINEALKKTEENLQKNAAKEEALPPKPAKPSPILLYILILLAGLFLANFIFNLLKHKTQAAQAPQKNTIAVPQPLAPLPPTPKPVAPAQPAGEKMDKTTSFILNGVFFSDNDGYALINNQIVREGDYVDGARVGLITTHTVELNNAGQTITLSTNR